jgi:hypothetical protein
MKNMILTFFILLGIMLEGCSHIPNMSKHIVNIINLQELGLKEGGDDPINLNYFYTKSFLYVADNVHKRIIGFNAQNRLFFELGKLSRENSHNDKNWEEKINDLANEMSSSKSYSKSNAVKIPLKKDQSIPEIAQSIRKSYQFGTLGKIAVDDDDNIYVENIIKINKGLSPTLFQKTDNNTLGIPNNNSIINNLLQERKKSDGLQQEIEILKFSPRGEFLYRIGEEGRDNPNFTGVVKILNFFFDKNNNIWVRYLKDDELYIRLYTNYGKNTLFFEEPQIKKTLDAHLLDNAVSDKYRIEDIYPLPNTRSIAVVINYFDSRRSFEIKMKQTFILDKNDVVEDIWKVKDKDSPNF